MEAHPIGPSHERRENIDRREAGRAFFYPDRRAAPRRSSERGKGPTSRRALTEIKRDIEPLVQAIDPNLTVLGVLSGGGDDYAEVLVGLNGCELEPCRIEVGINRSTPVSALEEVIRPRLQEYLRRHHG